MAMANDMSLYSDAPMEEEEAGMEMADSEAEGETTAILPMEILAGKEFEPGDSVILRIVAMHGDSIEVSYSHEDEAEPEMDMEEPPPPPDDMSELMG